MSMSDQEFAELLRKSVRPMGDEPGPRDLWPRMRERMERRPIAWSWFDAVLAAAAVLVCALAPHTLTAVFTHL